MSDDSASLRFSRLNDVNWAEWNVYMEAELIRKGLWAMIEIVVDEDGKDQDAVAAEYATKKGKRSAQKMSEARAEMILRVEGSQLPHMRSRDPLEVWENLKAVHRARGFATTLTLRRKLSSMKKRSHQTMQSWISEVRALSFRLSEAGVQLSDQDTILALTSGLPPSYDSLIVTFDTVSEITLDDIITRLLNEETRQGYPTRPAAPRSIPASSSDLDEAHVAARTPTCYFCNEVGHIKSDCKERKQWEAYKKSNQGGSESAQCLTEDAADDSDYDSESEASF